MKEIRKSFVNMLNNAKNFQIQSLSASIVNRACIKIAKELKRLGINGYICAQVHDQVIVRIEESKAEFFAPIKQDLMENTYKISIPLKAPVAIGRNFYEAH
jgi:DNA polymerase I